MREIKFRAWDGKSMWFPTDENDLMILLGDSGYFEVQDHGQGTKAVCLFNSADSNSVSLMQFTGLKDKNGKEIYEEDIFEWNDMVGQVIFEEGCFVFNCKYVRMTMRDHLPSEYKIIGNSYEHPHLLTPCRSTKGN